MKYLAILVSVVFYFAALGSLVIAGYSIYQSDEGMAALHIIFVFTDSIVASVILAWAIKK